MEVPRLPLPPAVQAGEGDVGGVLRLALEDVDGVGGFGGPQSAPLAGGTLAARTDSFIIIISGQHSGTLHSYWEHL